MPRSEGGRNIENAGNYVVDSQVTQGKGSAKAKDVKKNLLLAAIRRAARLSRAKQAPKTKGDSSTEESS